MSKDLSVEEQQPGALTAHAEEDSPRSDGALTESSRSTCRMNGSVATADRNFHAELAELARYIHETKQDIAGIKPGDNHTDDIPSATDELDAVVGATEDATNRIMDVCDAMIAIVSDCPADIRTNIGVCATRIFEACNFQDITGQRISKVVKALKHIDNRIASLVSAMGDDVPDVGGSSLHIARDTVCAESNLLNGPQLPGGAISQDDIDKLLSGS